MAVITLLDKAFFSRPVLDVAPDLLGKYLCTADGAWQITEVEAYDGPNDKACHAHRGKTERNAPMFGPAGHWYVYLVYGMYWMLNIVTDAPGYPAAVLIRGVRDYDGPGKLTKALGIDARFNALPATQESGLWIEDRGITIPTSQIQTTARIGIDYAKEWKDKPYRFVWEPKRES